MAILGGDLMDISGASKGDLLYVSGQFSDNSELFFGHIEGVDPVRLGHGLIGSTGVFRQYLAPTMDWAGWSTRPPRAQMAPAKPCSNI